MGWEGRDFIGFGWFANAISLLAVLTRLYIDYKGLRSVSIFREILLIVVFCCGIVAVVFDSIAVDKDFYNTDPFMFSYNSFPVQSHILKLLWIQYFFYMPAIYLCKIDLLLLYHQIAPRSHYPRIFWAIIVTWFFVIGGFIVVVFVPIFNCLPVSSNWDMMNFRSDEACLSALALTASTWGPHAFSDLLLYAIPLVIIFRMQKMTSSQKWSAASMFLAGFVNIISAVFLGVASLVIMIQNELVTRDMSGAMSFMTVVQGSTALWIICMPQVKNMYRLVLHKFRKGEKDTAIDISPGVADDSLEKTTSHGIGSDLAKVDSEEDKRRFA